jgi:hypothetical protein
MESNYIVWRGKKYHFEVYFFRKPNRPTLFSHHQWEISHLLVSDFKIVAVTLCYCTEMMKKVALGFLVQIWDIQSGDHILLSNLSPQGNLENSMEFKQSVPLAIHLEEGMISFLTKEYILEWNFEQTNVIPFRGTYFLRNLFFAEEFICPKTADISE